VTRWLVRFGYDGSPYSGWARQPHAVTVESEILGGVVRSGVASSASGAQVEVASRTDRGVHARANALTVTSEFSESRLLRALNGISPNLFFTAARAVPASFSVRTARQRWYRYFDPSEGVDLDARRRAAQLFHGYVDVRSFSAGHPSSTPVWRQVESVTVRAGRGVPWIDLRAPSFEWKQVRKMVAALREVDRKALTLERLAEAIEGRRRLALPLAEPEGLVLWEVAYDPPWPALPRARGEPFGWRGGIGARRETRQRLAVVDALLGVRADGR